MTPSIHIIGAGVAGLGLGWRLARAGFDVTLFDKGAISPGTTGDGASWAAAGMLAAVIEAEPGEDALLPFVLEAQRQWPDFTKELQDETGMDIGYRACGTLFIAPGSDDTPAIRQRHDFLKKRGLPISWLSRGELRSREPYFSPRVTEGFFSPQDHQVDNRKLVDALIIACKKSGVKFHAHTEIEVVQTNGNRCTGLIVQGKILPVETVILAAGAWSGALKGLPREILPPVYPLKGQMLALQMDAQRPLLRHVVWTPHVYLVPRDDGRLIIGATVEDRGFDTAQYAGSILHLLRETWDVLPGIEECPLLESWTGFRPTSRDDAPILGPSGLENLHFATGQHRHGILMTPLITAAMSDYIIKGRLPDIAAPFTMKRFEVK